MINRRIAPAFKPITAIHLPAASPVPLANGSTLYQINTGHQPAIKIELIFPAGSKETNQKAVAFMAEKMLLGGTSKYTLTQLAEQFSQYGGFTEVAQDAEKLSLTIFGLNHQLPHFLPLIADVLTDATIPAEEFATQQQISAQQLAVNLEKTSFVAGRELRRHLFGDEHPLGEMLTVTDIQQAERGEVLAFYQNEIKQRPFQVFFSGQFSAEHVRMIQDTLGQLPATPKADTTEILPVDLAPTTTLIEKQGSLQSSIRLGRPLLTRKHPDYFPMSVTNTLFGGYFGSRLMKNIREEKGYTYGISSSLVPKKLLGYMVIGTDVKREFTQQTLHEIGKEALRLQNEAVGEEELTTVKNYMLGSLAGSINNPFDIAEKQIMLLQNDLTADYYNTYATNINAVTAEQVMEMAQKYLQMTDFTEVVVGGK